MTAPTTLPPAHDPAPADAEAIRRIDTLASRLLARGIAPGYALAVTDRAGLVLERQYGVANQDAQRPVAPETLFEIGSIGKSFTAIVLMQLGAEGRIDLHAPVNTYLPWFSVQSEHETPITIHHLLTHTGGITGGSDHVPDPRYEVWTLRRTRTFAAPGECFLYSNLGYKALGLLLETVEGKPYAQIVRERIFQPLGMTGAEGAITGDMRPRLATGYLPYHLDRPWLPRYGVAPATWLETNTGDGCLSMSAADLATYLRTLLNDGSGPDGTILAPGQLETMLHPHHHADADTTTQPPAEPDYGYALHLADKDGGDNPVDRFGHSGGMVGYVSDMIADRTHGLGAVALCNGYGSPDELADYAIRALAAARAGEPLPDLPAADPDPTHIPGAAEYAGTYRNPRDGRTLTFVVDVDADVEGLTLETELAGETVRIPLCLAMTRRRGDIFLADHPAFDRVPFEFARASAPSAPGDPTPDAGATAEDAPKLPVVEVFHGNDWFMREGYDGPTTFEHPAEWEAYPGHYTSHNPWPHGFRIFLRKGALWMAYGMGGRAIELVPDNGGFRIGREKPNPDWLAFDVVVNGEAFVCRSENGEEYARFFTP
ncbi:MAG: serine hydrolase domain-containing protein [Thermomicrobiales bacterium]